MIVHIIRHTFHLLAPSSFRDSMVLFLRGWRGPDTTSLLCTDGCTGEVEGKQVTSIPRCPFFNLTMSAGMSEILRKITWSFATKMSVPKFLIWPTDTSSGASDAGSRSKCRSHPRPSVSARSSPSEIMGAQVLTHWKIMFLVSSGMFILKVHQNSSCACPSANVQRVQCSCVEVLVVRHVFMFCSKDSPHHRSLPEGSPLADLSLEEATWWESLIACFLGPSRPGIRPAVVGC